MSTKEEIFQEIKRLDQSQLDQLANYLAFIKYQSKIKIIPKFDDADVAALYAEFSQEDRELAEEGMDEYSTALTIEDVR